MVRVVRQGGEIAGMGSRRAVELINQDVVIEFFSGNYAPLADVSADTRLAQPLRLSFGGLKGGPLAKTKPACGGVKK